MRVNLVVRILVFRCTGMTNSVLVGTRYSSVETQLRAFNDTQFLLPIRHFHRFSTAVFSRGAAAVKVLVLPWCNCTSKIKERRNQKILILV